MMIKREHELGVEEGIARNMKQEKIDINRIQKITGLKREEIEKL